MNLNDAACGFRVIDPSVRFDGLSWGYGFLYDEIFFVNQGGSIGFAQVQARYDLNVFLLTKRMELLGLLESCRAWCNEGEIRSKVDVVIMKVKSWEKVTVVLNYGNGNTDNIIAHPLKDHHGYCFQRRNSDPLGLFTVDEKDQIFF